jgi:hypothetical protein
MIAPFPAGGPTDVVARVIARKLSDSWGQQVIVDNRAARMAYRTGPGGEFRADGYTLFVHSWLL